MIIDHFKQIHSSLFVALSNNNKALQKYTYLYRCLCKGLAGVQKTISSFLVKRKSPLLLLCYLQNYNEPNPQQSEQQPSAQEYQTHR